jgi:hypothetical protein
MFVSFISNKPVMIYVVIHRGLVDSDLQAPPPQGSSSQTSSMSTLLAKPTLIRDLTNDDI